MKFKKADVVLCEVPMPEYENKKRMEEMEGE